MRVAPVVVAPAAAETVDVLFSHAVLKEKGWPYHRSHYGKVALADMLGSPVLLPAAE